MGKSGKLSPNINLKEMGEVAIGLEIYFFVDKQENPLLSPCESDLLSSKLSIQDH